jgi:hypothetical protein
VLNNPHARRGLHDAHEAEHRVSRHPTVGVQHHRELETCRVMVEKIHHVSCFEARIYISPPIRDAVIRCDTCHRRFLLRDEPWLLRVRENAAHELAATPSLV